MNSYFQNIQWSSLIYVSARPCCLTSFFFPIPPAFIIQISFCSGRREFSQKPTEDSFLPKKRKIKYELTSCNYGAPFQINPPTAHPARALAVSGFQGRVHTNRNCHRDRIKNIKKKNKEKTKKKERWASVPYISRLLMLFAFFFLLDFIRDV